MLKIFKYPIPTESSCWIALPLGSRILSIDWQETSKSFCLWALVDPKQAPSPRRVRLVTTGESVDAAELRKLEFFCTAQANDGAFVAHFFVEPGGL